MNCRAVDNALVSNRTTPLPAAIRAHITNCERCGRLVRLLATPAAEPAVSPTLLLEIESRMLANLGPVRPMVPRATAFAMLLGLFAFAVALGVSSTSTAALFARSYLQSFVILGVLSAAAAQLALSLIQQMVPGSLCRVPPGLLPIGVLGALMVCVGALFQPHHDPDAWTHAWACFRAGTLLAAITIGPLCWLLRRGACLLPGVTGAAAGLYAGLVGTTMLEMHCPNLDVRHILAAHLGVAMLCTSAGLATGAMMELVHRKGIAS